jgi:hypothetical protein
MNPKLAALIAFPIDWTSETGEEQAASSILQYDWYHCHNSHAVSVDEHISDVLGFEDLDLDESEVARLIANIEPRRGAAEGDHRERAGRLEKLHFVSPLEYGKHFAAGIQRDELLRRSRSGVSYFYANYDHSALRATFWSWFFTFFDQVYSLQAYEEMLSGSQDADLNRCSKLWQQFLVSPQLRIAFDCMRSVGASRGRDTSYLCFDVHEGKAVHAFPIDENDANKIMEGGPILPIDAFNC